MAELSTLARPYARAAFEYASTENALNEWLSELQLVSVVVDDDAVRNLLGDPSLTTEKQAEAFIGLFGDELGDSRKRFLHVLAENRRLGLMPNILTQFAQLKAQR